MQVDSLKKPDLVFNNLLARISSGHWKVGDQIPTEGVLAEEFRCSRGTISKALNRLTHEGMIERRTRAGTRILQSSPVRSSQQSLVLDACAFIHPSQQHEGVWRTGRGFQQAAYGVKFRTLMLSTGSDFRKEAEIIGRLSEFDVKGAVLFPVILAPEDLAFYTQMILACRFPLVLVELNISGIGRPAVVADGLHAGYTVTQHLLRQGLRKIGFLANYAWASIVREKYLGYRQAMEEAGVLETGPFVHLDQGMNPRFDDPLTEPTELARTYLKNHPGIEGVVCSHDFLAIGVLRAAQELGLAVPRDLKVVGIDDYALANSGSVGLTTYRVPYETIGEKAFGILHGILSGESPNSNEIQIRGELIVRESA